MKSFAYVVLAALVVAKAFAQADVVTVTSYTNDCSSYYDTYTSTTTATLTETYCGECEMGMNKTTTRKPGVWTTYATVYREWCPTGLVAKTYTITESCKTTGTPRPTHHIPSGFRITTDVCTVCASPMTAVLTTPIATPALPATATATPSPYSIPLAPGSGGAVHPSASTTPPPAMAYAANTTDNACDECTPGNANPSPIAFVAAGVLSASLNVLFASIAVVVTVFFFAL